MTIPAPVCAECGGIDFTPVSTLVTDHAARCDTCGEIHDLRPIDDRWPHMLPAPADSQGTLCRPCTVGHGLRCTCTSYCGAAGTCAAPKPARQNQLEDMP